jgi:hypothetical protein
MYYVSISGKSILCGRICRKGAACGAGGSSAESSQYSRLQDRGPVLTVAGDTPALAITASTNPTESLTYSSTPPGQVIVILQYVDPDSNHGSELTI